MTAPQHAPLPEEFLAAGIAINAGPMALSPKFFRELLPTGNGTAGRVAAQ
jgi:hypothetical protein